MDQIGERLIALTPASADPHAVADEVVRIVGLAKGARPMRSVIDFVDGLQGAGFKVDNPNVIAACGCGSSFRVAEAEEVSAV